MQDFKSFLVNRRENINYSIVHQNPDYIEASAKYSKYYEEIMGRIPEESKKEVSECVEGIYSSVISMMGIEADHSYLQGLQDGMEFKTIIDLVSKNRVGGTI